MGDWQVGRYLSIALAAAAVPLIHCATAPVARYVRRHMRDGWLKRLLLWDGKQPARRGRLQ